MSAGWEIGDLALCVDASYNAAAAHPSHLVEGRIYIVTSVVENLHGTGLHVDWSRPPEPFAAWMASRFRKILPDKHEACETEFVTLLNRIKQPVEAERSALFMGGK